MGDAVTATTGVVPGFWIMMLKSIGMLCIVLAVLAGILFVFKYFTEKRTGGMSRNFIRLLSSFHLSPREKLMLIDVAGRKLLLGVTQQSITTLAELDKEEEITLLNEVPSKEKEQGFKHILEKLMGSVPGGTQDNSKKP